MLAARPPTVSQSVSVVRARLTWYAPRSVAALLVAVLLLLWCCVVYIVVPVCAYRPVRRTTLLDSVNCCELACYNTRV